ncbi:MAG: CBS domain-containing protein [Acidobacteriota bacterium]|nr:CBS domain-containing protein [Acidobacteriota bacterium]
MNVREVMTTEVISVRRETPLREVARTLSERGISGVPVVGDDGAVVGVVSETDILFKERGPTAPVGLLAQVLDPRSAKERAKMDALTAGEAMSSPAKTIAPWRSVAAAATEMLDEEVNRLPVIDADGRLVGIVSRADLVRAFVRPDEEIEREIRNDVLRTSLWLSAPDEVTVAVREGKVALGGIVDSRTDSELVPAFAARVPGVVAVESSIEWRTETGERR